MLVVTHQRVMPIIITDNHFDGNTRGESRELRATNTCAAPWNEKRDIVSQGKGQNCNYKYRVHAYLLLVTHVFQSTQYESSVFRRLAHLQNKDRSEFCPFQIRM